MTVPNTGPSSWPEALLQAYSVLWSRFGAVSGARVILVVAQTDPTLGDAPRLLLHVAQPSFAVGISAISVGPPGWRPDELATLCRRGAGGAAWHVEASWDLEAARRTVTELAERHCAPLYSLSRSPFHPPISLPMTVTFHPYWLHLGELTVPVTLSPDPSQLAPPWLAAPHLHMAGFIGSDQRTASASSAVLAVDYRHPAADASSSSSDERDLYVAVRTALANARATAVVMPEGDAGQRIATLGTVPLADGQVQLCLCPWSPDSVAVWTDALAEHLPGGSRAQADKAAAAVAAVDAAGDDADEDAEARVVSVAGVGSRLKKVTKLVKALPASAAQLENEYSGR